MRIWPVLRRFWPGWMAGRWSVPGFLVTFPMHRPCPELEWHASFDSVGPRREAEALSIGPAEVGLAGKSRRDRNFWQLHIRLRDKTSGSVEPHVAVVEHRPL